jgi:hypothetical protein
LEIEDSLDSLGVEAAAVVGEKREIPGRVETARLIYSRFSSSFPVELCLSESTIDRVDADGQVFRA